MGLRFAKECPIYIKFHVLYMQMTSFFKIKLNSKIPNSSVEMNFPETHIFHTLFN